MRHDLFIGNDSLVGKGVYANRDFKKGEMITCDATKDDVEYSCKFVRLTHFDELWV